MLNEIYKITLRAVISVSALFILARIMGKKQIAHLTFFDYIIAISIGSISAQGAVDPSIGFLDELTVLIVYTLFSLVLSFVSIKSYFGRKLLDGTPLVLIENGNIIEQGLKKAKLNVNDLLKECRQKNIFNIEDIEFAILETSGQLSILLKSSNQPLTPKDMNIVVSHKGLCTNVIIDGKIISEHLPMINKDENWLNTKLSKYNIKDYSDVLLAYVDTSDNLTVLLKNINSSIKSI